MPGCRGSRNGRCQRGDPGSLKRPGRRTRNASGAAFGARPGDTAIYGGARGATTKNRCDGFHARYLRRRTPIPIPNSAWDERPVGDDLLRAAGGKLPEHAKTPPSPLTGDERCGPVVPPLFAAALRPATSLHGDALGAGMWWSTAGAQCIGPVTGACSPELRGPVAAYCTEIFTIRGSGRCSRVLFAGIPDPASQQSRFSASTLPGTRPCRRK